MPPVGLHHCKDEREEVCNDLFHFVILYSIYHDGNHTIHYRASVLLICYAPYEAPPTKFLIECSCFPHSGPFTNKQKALLNMNVESLFFTQIRGRIEVEMVVPTA